MLLGLALSVLLPVEYLFAVFEVKEVHYFRKTLRRELLVFRLKETERHLSDERCPARVAAERAHDAIAERQRVQIENST